jgi:hypothetical protein
MERENLAGDAKGKGTNGSNREAESTDALARGGLLRSSAARAVRGTVASHGVQGGVVVAAMPLALTDAALRAVMAVAGQLPVERRGEFLQRLARELEARPGDIHRIALAVAAQIAGETAMPPAAYRYSFCFGLALCGRSRAMAAWKRAFINSRCSLDQAPLLFITRLRLRSARVLGNRLGVRRKIPLW